MTNQLPVHNNPWARAASALAFILALVSNAMPAAADDIDVSTFEYIDVVETFDGSILKGVVTEQLPNLHYKLATADGSVHVIIASTVVRLAKQKNPNYHGARSPLAAPASASVPARSVEVAMLRGDELSPIDSVAQAAPTATAAPGLRIDPELAFAFPSGDLVDLGMTTIDYRASLAPGGRVGYETYRGNVALAVGGMVRYTSWRLPVELEGLGSHSTLETQVYGRASLLLGRAMPYAGASFGVDTNHSVNNLNGVSTTAMGFGMNVMTGLSIAASKSAAIDLGLDFHPGTDKIEEGLDASVSYFALRLGASLRL